MTASPCKLALQSRYPSHHNVSRICPLWSWWQFCHHHCRMASEVSPTTAGQCEKIQSRSSWLRYTSFVTVSPGVPQCSECPHLDAESTPLSAAAWPRCQKSLAEHWVRISPAFDRKPARICSQTALAGSIMSAVCFSSKARFRIFVWYLLCFS